MSWISGHTWLTNSTILTQTITDQAGFLVQTTNHQQQPADLTAAAAAAAAAATAAQTAATGGGGGTPHFQTDPAATNQFGQAGNDNFLEASDFAASLHDTTGSSSILQVGKLVC